MSKSNIVIIIYILGIFFAAIFLNMWSAETNPRKALLGILWTAIFLISLFYVEKK